MICRLLSISLLLIVFACHLKAESKPPELLADVVVYGDAAAGVAAAVQAARMGKSVILVSQYGHLGGLSSSGLGYTDIGNSRILGGISREFYHRVYLHYQKDEAWVRQPKESFPKNGQGAPTFDAKTELASVFEPKVAEMIFDQLVEEAAVKVVNGRLDLDQEASMEGKRITAIRLEDGTVIRGKMFIDASYEGDIQMSLGGKPYPISYRSIIPAEGECENLLVPWCLSSSHIAFGSIRMEPVGMVLGQSAATAAVQAIDAGSSVQGIDYKKLEEKLTKDGQVLVDGKE